MAKLLRQSTASQEIVIGRMVDSTDGNTEETGLTIANTDIKIWKTGATTLANKNSGGATHIANGLYSAVLDATDTDTLGPLKVYVHVSGALSWEDSYQVVPAVIYDSFILGTDLFDVNISQIDGSAVLASGGRPQVNLTHISGAAVSASTAQLGVNAVQISGDSVAADNLESAFDDSVGRIPWTGIVDQGTAQSATSTTLVLRAAAAFADDELIGATIQITGGSAGVGQSRLITDYVGATDTATVDAWTTTPTGTITYKIYGTAPSSGGGGLDAAGVRSAIGMASANMDTQLSGIQSDTNDIQTRLPAALVGGRIDASVGAMATDVITSTALAASAVTEIQSGLATSAALDAVDNFVDTEITALQSDVTAIRAKTDSLTFTQAGHVDANIQRINDVTITGNGQSGTEFSV